MINCIIVDDQQEAVDVIVEHTKRIPEISVLKTFTDSIEALHFLESNKIDLAFLDVDMPNLNGIELIESHKAKIGSAATKFILTTGYPDYAISGFDQGVVDYLLKPVVFKRLKQSFERFIETTKGTQIGDVNSGTKEYFFIESDGSKLKLNYRNIAYIESEKNCVHIIESNAKKTIRKPMHYIEGLLESHKDFIRVHKSFIISVNYIDVVKLNEIVLNISGTKKTISLGGTYRDDVLRRIK
jgi:two-component system LytT family response regulator